MTKLPNVTLTGLELSDLFFNSPLKNYNQTSSYAEPIEIKTALMEDAEDFLTDGMKKSGITAEMLADDFLARL